MRRCGNSRRKGHDVEAKEFGRFIAGMRKEKKMTQAELAEQIHVTDKAVSRWERGLGFPDIQTIEPLAQALGISVLELMRSERQEKAKEEAAPEIQYTQKEVAEMLQNAGDISRQQKKQDRNANVIAGFLVIGVAAAAWAAKIVNVGGGLILGGLVAAAFVSLWYFFQNLDDEESRKVYGAASILSIGILASLVNFVWGDQLAEFIPGGLERKEQIFWTLWYLFVLVMMMIGTIRCIRRQRQKKEKKYKFSSLGKNARFRTYEESFLWLNEAMIVNTCFNATDPNIGLALSADNSTQKCYMADTGLLVTLTFMDRKFTENELYRSILFDKLNVNEGMIMENIVAQMLRANGHKLYFYSRSDSNHRENNLEIDFLISENKKISPIEVKSGNYQSHVSLDKFRLKFSEKLKNSYVLYGKDVMLKDGIIHLPFYMAMFL